MTYRYKIEYEDVIRGWGKTVATKNIRAHSMKDALEKFQKKYHARVISIDGYSGDDLLLKLSQKARPEEG